MIIEWWGLSSRWIWSRPII